jgi:hypothetical protein
VTAEPFLRKGD